MAIGNAAQPQKTVADPVAEYETLKPLWNRSRAVCAGERYAKDFDSILDTVSYTNLLVPFSPSMTQQQFNFYKAEAELPGVVAQFSRMLVGGLLRKKPTVVLPGGLPKEALDWLTSKFAQDESSLVSFMDEALMEELQTSRAWVYVDFPSVPEGAMLTPEQMAELKPYPVLWKAETVINWRMGQDPKTGLVKLNRVITRGFEEEVIGDETPANEDDFHPKLVDTVRVHELDALGFYQVRVFQAKAPTNNVPVVAGQRQPPTAKPSHVLVETIANITMHEKRLTIIPAWPLNGSVQPQEPVLTPLVDKEVALYNKISRRNHLLYGASTYTPVIMSDMLETTFEDIVGKGLGSWILLPENAKIDVLKTPTEALADMDRAIAAGYEEMARLGVRMLSPEVEQSGVALEIRNASQNAQIGTLNTKISDTMGQVVALMLMWRYDRDFEISEVKFTLSEDFNPVPLGADWLRLATEWYQQGLIPRSVWLIMLKQNDMVPPDYDDEEGQQEITEAQDLLVEKANEQYADQLKLEQEVMNNGNKAAKPE